MHRMRVSDRSRLIGIPFSGQIRKPSDGSRGWILQIQRTILAMIPGWTVDSGTRDGLVVQRGILGSPRIALDGLI